MQLFSFQHFQNCAPWNTVERNVIYYTTKEKKEIKGKGRRGRKGERKEGKRKGKKWEKKKRKGTC